MKRRNYVSSTSWHPDRITIALWGDNQAPQKGVLSMAILGEKTAVAQEELKKPRKGLPLRPARE